MYVRCAGKRANSPLIEIFRHHRLQAMLRPEEKIVNDTAELNGIPDLGKIALPDTYHFLDTC